MLQHFHRMVDHFLPLFGLICKKLPDLFKRFIAGQMLFFGIIPVAFQCIHHFCHAPLPVPVKLLSLFLIFEFLFRPKIDRLDDSSACIEFF